VLLAGTATAIVTVSVPSASAGPGDTVHGGCFTHTASNAVVTQGQTQGVLGVQAVMTNDSNAPDASGRIDCKIQVNGVDTAGGYITVAANAAGVVQGQQQISYDDQGGTLPTSLCERDSFGDGDSTGWYCDGQAPIPSPPPVPTDVDGAYCPYGSITGTGNWTTPVTAVVSPHVFTWDTNASCAGADEGGAYHIVFQGTSNDACTAGTGAGTLAGDGPEGPIAGSFTFYRGGIHLYISGSYASGGEQHSLQYWIDVLPSTDAVCSYTTARLLAHGAMYDQYTP
jgi:hypothetical protein